MAHKFIENGDRTRVYDSVVIDPRKLNIFGSELALRVVEELAKNPCCAMDIARQLNEHEQKIYYHLRRLEDAGIIKKIRTEKRYAMTAKIYALVSPTVTAKLHSDGYEEVNNDPRSKDPIIEGFLHPFVSNGQLNAKIVIGNPYPHGRYNEAGKGGSHVFDLGVLVGNMINVPIFPAYVLDTNATETDLKGNLILVGNCKENNIIYRINENLPAKFSMEGGEGVTSPTGKKYTDPRVGLILKTSSPFNEGKKILIIGGMRTRGTQTAVIALTRHFQNIVKDNNGKMLYAILEGSDSDGDDVIDSIKVLETGGE